ncbi:Protein fam72a, partial [Nowakowskiella sp. JEL0078]
MGLNSAQQQAEQAIQTRGETPPVAVSSGTQNEVHRQPEWPVGYNLNGNQILIMLQSRGPNSIHSSNSFAGATPFPQLSHSTSQTPSDQQTTAPQSRLLRTTTAHALQTVTRQGQSSQQQENEQREQRTQSAPGSRQTQSSPRPTTFLPTTTSVRPQFRSKIVCQLACKYCRTPVCQRGMKAILLADTNVELYSTDSPPAGVQLVNEDYITRNCQCRIRDVACLGCGNVVGYHVTQPCETCLEACNNGHFWMFHVDQVGSSERMDVNGSRTLLWAHLPRADKDIDSRDIYELMC